MNCRLIQISEGLVQCERCGWVLAWSGKPSRVTIKCSETRHTGLGDHTEQLLATFGVTKDRYAAAKAAVGLAPECNCTQRREQLNEWGRRVTSWWQGM